MANARKCIYAVFVAFVRRFRVEIFEAVEHALLVDPAKRQRQQMDDG
jgi:hypothetical protein